MLVGLLERDSRIRLHLFAGSAGAYGAGFGGQVVEHPADEPWPDLFDSIDLVVLPQARTSGGEVQLPAKLLDAMRFGVPIVTSPTEAIVEAAAETVVYVESWSDLSEVAAAINRCVCNGNELGAAAKERFDRVLSLESLAPPTRQFFGELARDGDERRNGQR